jgi:hypothetical protein
MWCKAVRYEGFSGSDWNEKARIKEDKSLPFFSFYLKPPESQEK